MHDKHTVAFLFNAYIQGSYTFSKIKIQAFSSIFKVHFQAFPAPYNCGKLLLVYNTYCMYSIPIISLLHRIKSDVIVLETMKNYVS